MTTVTATRLPPWYAWALAELGVAETPGPRATQRILDYRTIAGIPLAGDDGAVPWCAIFVNAALAQAKLPTSGNAMARGLLRYGAALPGPAKGAICVISSARGPMTGHTFFCTGRVTATHVEGLGGNQSDAVSIAWWPLARVLGYRWPAGVPLPSSPAVKIATSAQPKSVSDA